MATFCIWWPWTSRWVLISAILLSAWDCILQIWILLSLMFPPPWTFYLAMISFLNCRNFLKITLPSGLRTNSISEDFFLPALDPLLPVTHSSKSKGLLNNISGPCFMWLCAFFFFESVIKGTLDNKGRVWWKMESSNAKIFSIQYKTHTLFLMLQSDWSMYRNPIRSWLVGGISIRAQEVWFSKRMQSLQLT